jgi:glutathione S-transferase
MPIEFVELEEAKQRGGVRLVTVPGVPSAWGESAKGILHVKDIPFAAVRLVPGDNPVTQWTGEQSAPVLMYEDEPPRSGWAEILLLAERLAPDPALIPADAGERALLFGLAHEICGEMGLGWCRRLEGVALGLESDGARGFSKPMAAYLAPRYGYRPGCGDEAHQRVVDILGALSARLHAQREAGSDYYFGGALTALDIYSATFMGFFRPLPPEQCPMPDVIRAAFETSDPDTDKALDPILLTHRDQIYDHHLELPLSL